MTTDTPIFVKITKVFMLTPEQAKAALDEAWRRASSQNQLNGSSDRVQHSAAGDRYLTPEGEHHIAGAICDLPDPVGLLGVEPIMDTSAQLSEAGVIEATGHPSSHWLSIGQ